MWHLVCIQLTIHRFILSYDVLYFKCSVFCHEGFAGVGMTTIFIPIQIYLASKFAGMRTLTAASTDQRVRYISEVIDGIATVKASGWETPFYSLICSYRKTETDAISSSQTLRSVNQGLYYFSSPVAAFATFAVYWGTGGILTIPLVFSTISLLQVLRVSIALHWTRSIERGSEAIASCHRIEFFLNLIDAHTNELLKASDEAQVPNESSTKDKQYTSIPTDADVDQIELTHDSKESSDFVVLHPSLLYRVDKASYCYDGSSEGKPILNNITFSVSRGELLVVVGAVGSGND